MEPKKIEVIAASKGMLTVVKVDCGKDEVILVINGKDTIVRDRYTIQLESDLHVIPNENAGKYVNHSCSPNMEMNGSREFIALQDIKAGEEITFDYDSTEDDIAEPFDCFCGHDNCRGRVGR